MPLAVQRASYSGEVQLLIVLDKKLAPVPLQRDTRQFFREEFGIVGPNAAAIGPDGEISSELQKRLLHIPLAAANSDILLLLEEFEPPPDTQIIYRTCHYLL